MSRFHDVGLFNMYHSILFPTIRCFIKKLSLHARQPHLDVNCHQFVISSVDTLQYFACNDYFCDGLHNLRYYPMCYHRKYTVATCNSSIAMLFTIFLPNDDGMIMTIHAHCNCNASNTTEFFQYTLDPELYTIVYVLSSPLILFYHHHNVLHCENEVSCLKDIILSIHVTFQTESWDTWWYQTSCSSLYNYPLISTYWIVLLYR